MTSPTALSTRRGASPEPSANGRMLTVSQAADILGAHPNSVRRWADLDLIPSYRLGLRGDRRFKREDVLEFLTSGKSRRANGVKPG